MTETDTIAIRAERVRSRVAEAAKRSGRPKEAVTIIGVSKTVPVESIRAAFDLGFTSFGENRVQEARLKIAELRLPGIQWELIGHLQTNKAAQAAQLFTRIESIDSLRLAKLLNGAATQQGRILPIMLEVNVSGEISKSGLKPDELMEAAAGLNDLTSLRPEGLMTIAPLTQDPEQARPIFRQLRRLRDQLQARAQSGSGHQWHQLSMGMSDDFEVAIEEGATIVRIGRALFGARPPAAE